MFLLGAVILDSRLFYSENPPKESCKDAQEDCTGKCRGNQGRPERTGAQQCGKRLMDFWKRKHRS